MSDANARLDFLWKASHMLLSTCPGASSHCMSQFLNLANSRDLRLHEDIQAKSCAACGSIFVPGVNAKVRVVPVKETRLERERRKKQARKKVKIEKRKQAEAGKDKEQKGNNDIQETPTPDVKPIKPTSKGSNSTSITDELSAALLPSTAKNPSNAHQPAITRLSSSLPTSQQPARKVIHITPYTELAQQQQQAQQNQRRQLSQLDGKHPKKIDKRASQLLNHVVYSCQRCQYDTELPGTKEGYLNTRIKSKKPVSQRRRMKKEQEQQQAIMASTISGSTATVITSTTAGSRTAITATTTKSGMALLSTTTANTKRPASPLSTPALLNAKRPKHAMSLPASPVGGLSMASSIASSAASSPVSSPRIDNNSNKLGGGGGGGNNRKKKKGGLASMLASQKSKDPSSDPGAGGASGTGGDSVLANFLMGL